MAPHLLGACNSDATAQTDPLPYQRDWSDNTAYKAPNWSCAYRIEGKACC